MATVPGTPMDDSAFGGIPRELRPTQADFLIAAAMHAQQEQQTKLAALTEKDQPMIEDTGHTGQGVTVEMRRIRREEMEERPPTNVYRMLRPGEEVPDPELGVRSGRTVKGI